MKKLTAPVLLVGTAAESADLRYASGFGAVDPVVHLRDGKKDFLIVPMMELGRAKREVKRGVCVLTPSDLRLKKAERRRISSWMIALLRDRRIRKARGISGARSEVRARGRVHPRVAGGGSSGDAAGHPNNFKSASRPGRIPGRARTQADG
jgi:hypothetical protein